MSSTPRLPTLLAALPALAALMLACTGALAQQAPADALAAAQAAAQPKAPVDQRIERLRIEDGGSVVDELRVGGQSQSITVSPKAPVPSYEIVPGNPNRSGALARDASPASGGERVWNVFRF